MADQTKRELPEFIYGHLSTREGRLKRARLGRLGFVHDSVLSPADPQPGETITIEARVGGDLLLDRVDLYYTSDGSQPSVPPTGTTKHLPMERTQLEWDTLEWCFVERWQAQIPAQPNGTTILYRIQGLKPSGEVIDCPSVDASTRRLVENPDDYDLDYLGKLSPANGPQCFGFTIDDLEPPEWLRKAVIYQIFVDRFAPDPGKKFASPERSNGFYGGTLKGIAAKLDYLEELGVNCIWLTPIFPSPSYHGYDATDYDTIEPRLGDMGDFERLVEAAHQRGIRVLLDFVANHFSKEHPAFQAALKDRASPTYEWFLFTDWPEAYECFYNIENLPKVNTDHPGVREYLIGSACRWLARGADGFRLDHAHGVTHAFWSAFRTSTRATKADSAIFGEVTETPAVVRSYSGRMDGCLDFHLLEILRAYFVFHTLNASEFDKLLRQHFEYFGAHLVLPSFLDNHDMSRFIWRVEGDARRLRLAALCQFTLPGTPIIYYGTEVGLSQLAPLGWLEEARLPMPWGNDQDKDLLAYYKSLIALRRGSLHAWQGKRRTLLIDDQAGIYAYACEPYQVYLNNSDCARALRQTGSPGASKSPGLLTLGTDEGVALSDKGDQLFLPPYSGAVIQVTSSQYRHP